VLAVFSKRRDTFKAALMLHDGAGRLGGEDAAIAFCTSPDVLKVEDRASFNDRHTLKRRNGVDASASSNNSGGVRRPWGRAIGGRGKKWNVSLSRGSA
jgi:hypothetical protein